jgi:hypothetical protein
MINKLYTAKMILVVYNIFVSRLSREDYTMSEKRPAGRPKGEESTIINVRVPKTLLARLDRYLDKLEAETSLSANWGTITRNALKVFLEARGY